MNLSISVWVESQYAANLASVYDSVNHNKEVLAILPHIIIDISKLEAGKCYTQFYISYNMYMELLAVEKRKEIPTADLDVIKNVTMQAAGFNMQYDIIWKAMNLMKQNPTKGIGECFSECYMELINAQPNAIDTQNIIS